MATRADVLAGQPGPSPFNRASSPENRWSVRVFRTAMASAFFWPTSTTSCRPRVTPVDLRRGFDGLCAHVQTVLEQEVVEGGLFVFTNRRPQPASFVVV